MSDQLACNINFYFYLRFFLGFYHDFQTSKSMRWLARCYCCVTYTCLITSYHILNTNFKYPPSIIILTSSEYCLYMLISLITGNTYLLQYYKKTSFVDLNAKTYTPMIFYLIGYISVMYFIRFCGLLKAVLIQDAYGTFQYSLSVCDFFVWCAILIGRSPLLFVFALLYTRVRKMRQTLESNNFDCTKQGKLHPRRYIQMYEAIMDGLEESTNTIKLQLFIFSVGATSYYLFGVAHVLYLIKSNLWNISYYFAFELFWFLVETTVSCTPLFLSAFLADMVSMEIQEMLAIIVERRTACKSERDYAEIQKLFQSMISRPFHYTLLRVVPLNVRSLFSFLSFCITNFISLLQITSWTK